MSFLESVVLDLIRRAGLRDLHNYTLVFPMQRAGLFVKRIIADEVARSGQPVLLPHLTTIDALVDSLSALHAEDELLSVCSLYQIYREQVDDHVPLDVFYGWGQQLLSDFSNADMSLQDVHHLFRHASEAAELEKLTLDDEVRERLLSLLGEQGRSNSVRLYFQRLWEHLPEVYAEFTRQQQSRSVGTKGARYRWVIEHIEELRPRLAERRFLFVGFNYLLGAERRLMELLCDQAAECLFYWDYDPAFCIPESHVYKFLEQNIQQFKKYTVECTSTASDSSTASQSSIEAIACQSSLAQAQYVHDWLLAHHHPGNRTAVILADESLLESVIYALPEQLEAVNVTKGYPLRNTRIYALAQRLLEQVEQDERPEAVLESLARELERAFRGMKRSADDSWQQILSDEAYYQTQAAVRHFRLLLADNPQLSTLPTRLLLSTLNSQLSTLSIPFHGEPVTEVQLMGVLESRLLDFDNLLILNVEEGVVPNTSVDHSFIPYDLRRLYGMQTREEESTIYGYNFFRLIRRARHVTLTYSEAMDEQGKKSMSRFLMQMLASPAYAVSRLRLTESAEQHSVELGETCMRPSDQMPAHLSPSSICDFIGCPREFYLKQVRRIREPEDTSVLFQPSTLGSLVHGTLEFYYRSRCPLSEALDKAYAEVNRLYLDHHREAQAAPYCRSDHEAENFVILRMAQNVIDRDNETPGLSVLELEKQCLCELDGFRLKGTIDRLDSLQVDGKRVLRVVDYKTGSAKHARLKVESVEQLFSDPACRYALQTLIYCLMAEADMPELVYPRELSADGRIQFQGEPVTDFQHQLAPAFREALVGKMREIYATTHFPPAPPESCCSASGVLKYCPFHQLCNRPLQSY